MTTRKPSATYRLSLTTARSRAARRLWLRVNRSMTASAGTQCPAHWGSCPDHWSEPYLGRFTKF